MTLIVFADLDIVHCAQYMHVRLHRNVINNCPPVSSLCHMCEHYKIMTVALCACKADLQKLGYSMGTIGKPHHNSVGGEVIVH